MGHSRESGNTVTMKEENDRCSIARLSSIYMTIYPAKDSAGVSRRVG